MDPSGGGAPRGTGRKGGVPKRVLGMQSQELDFDFVGRQAVHENPGMSGSRVARSSPQGRIQLQPSPQGRAQLQPIGVSQINRSPENSANSPQTTNKSTQPKPNIASVKRNPIKRKPNGATALPTKPVLPNIEKNEKKNEEKYDNKYENVLLGMMENIPEQRTNSVRIFLSSTFSDFKMERNALTKMAYPALKTYCRERDMDFEVMDLRWGITDEATNDHSVENLCLQEIKHCRRVSQGPNFVVMLGNRYGFRPLAVEIREREFDILFNTMKEMELENLDLVQQWYKKDENSQPVVYRLQSIRTYLPHFADPDPANDSKRREETAEWNNIQSKLLQPMFRQSAIKAGEKGLLDAESVQMYICSVTEKEVGIGMLNLSNASQTCIGFMRNFNDVDINPDDATGCRFFDIPKGSNEINRETDSLMVKLKSDRIEKVLAKENIDYYDVKWTDGGINISEHQEYLEKLCEDFVNKLKTLIQKHMEETKAERQAETSFTVKIEKGRNENSDSKKPVVEKKSGKPQPFSHNLNKEANADIFMGFMQMKNMISAHEEIEKDDFKGAIGSDPNHRLKVNSEILHHLYMAKKKSETFCGRESELAAVKTYLSQKGSSKPLIIHAPSGAGKTAFAAVIAKTTKSMSFRKCTTILRFLGTTPKSSTLLKVITSICEQICAAYGEPLHRPELSRLSRALSYFTNLLVYVSAKYGTVRPLYIILDSVDQLSPSGGAHFLKWLPKSVPANIKVIVTFLPEAFNLLENAKEHLGNSKSFISLNHFTSKEAFEMCELYLKHKNRKLTEDQMRVLQDAVNKNSHPLLVKLWLDTTHSWCSYDDINNCTLPDNVQEAVDKLFSKMEHKYGETVIRKTLGYITLCKDGITQIELEDVLSCDDELLCDVYKYHNPPIDGVVRIPPLLWARIRNDLSEYIVERQSNSRSTLAWYHRQFKDTATERYGSGATANDIHSQLADLFLVDDKLLRTINLKHRKMTIENADRVITPQYLVPSNTRKLVALFYHLSKSGDAQKFKNALLDFRILQCLAESLAHGKYKDDAAEALDFFEIDDDTEKVIKAVNLSYSLFIKDASLFPTLLLGQLLVFKSKSTFINSLCQSVNDFIDKSKVPHLVPMTACVPGGSGSALSYFVKGPNNVLSKSVDGQQILVANQNKNIVCQVIDCSKSIISMSLQRSAKSIGTEEVVKGVLSNMSRRVFILTKGHILIWTSEGKETKVQYQSNDVNKKGRLNSTILVSKDDRYLIVAGAARLAMFEDTNGQYVVKRAMDLAGCTETSNLIFSDDLAMTFSSHKVKLKGKEPIGVVVSWDFWAEKLIHRVVVSAAIVSGSLCKVPQYGLPDIVVCACVDGRLFTINMAEGKVLKNFAVTQFTGSSVITAFDSQSSILAISARDGNRIEVWDVLETSKKKEIKVDIEVTCLSILGDGNHLGIGSKNGL